MKYIKLFLQFVYYLILSEVYNDTVSAAELKKHVYSEILSKMTVVNNLFYYQVFIKGGRHFPKFVRLILERVCLALKIELGS